MHIKTVEGGDDENVFLPMARALASLGCEPCISGHGDRASDGTGPVKSDAKHYKVDFENAQVRVLRITYGPHEKSVMHAHPASVAVFLTDGNVKFTLPDGKTLSSDVKGRNGAMERCVTSSRELGDKPFELNSGELKGKHAAKAK